MIKPFLNYPQQINKLITEKHLIITDIPFAEKKLKEIGYFNLIGGYKKPFRNPMTRIYIDNTTFEDIYALYQFDNHLRKLIFQYLCQIEMKVCTSIAYAFCEQFGEAQSEYLTKSNYNYTSSNQLNIDKLIRILDRLANINTDYDYIIHQRKTHQNVPLWVLINALTFGQISKMYSFLSSKTKCKVSLNFDFVNEKDLFGVVIAFRYLLPNEDFLIFKKKLNKLIDKYIKCSSRISEDELLDMMGFPLNWKNITRYKF